MHIQDLINERAGLVAESRRILDTAARAKRDLTSSEEQKYDEMNSRITEIGKIIDRHQALAEVENRLASERDFNPRKTEAATPPSDEVLRAYANYLLTGEKSNLLLAGTDTKGGFLLPETLETQIIQRVTDADPIRQIADVRTSRTLVKIPVETTKITFGWLGEGSEYPQLSPSLGREVLTAHKGGFIVPVSDELLADSAASITEFIVGAASRAIEEGTNESYYVGNGVNKPLGLFNVVKVGGDAGIAPAEHTTAPSPNPVFTADDLIDLQHALKRTYRPRAGFIMRDSVERTIRKLKAHDNQYIWQPGLTASQPNLLLGSPVYVSDYAPAPAVSSRFIAYGDIRAAYRIQDRLGMEVFYMGERYADQGKKAWRFTIRTDGRVVNGEAIAFLKAGPAS
jgi:HK97 family phage major capsid protein